MTRLPLFHLALAALSLSIGCSRSKSEATTSPPAPTAAERAPGELTATDALMLQTKNAAQFFERQASKQKRDWMSLERAAGAHLELARLNGEMAQYAKAQKLIERAFARAAKGSGPFMTRAHLNFSLHRFDDVERDLKRAASAVLVSKSTRAEIEALRGDIALQRGDVERARAQYAKAGKLATNTSLLARRANLAYFTGHPQEARALMEQAIERSAPKRGPSHAWLLLRRGILDLEAGHLEDAERYFLRAEQAFPGWYLVEEHLAEVHAKRGDLKGATARYRDIVARTQLPEFKDALADVLAQLGKEGEAKRLWASSRADYTALIKAFPEASYGHALDHFLSVDLGQGEAQRALELAKQNDALRPGGEAKAKLAQALLRSDDVTGAQRALDAALKQGFSTVALHEVGVKLAQASGDGAGLARHQAELARLRAR